MLVWAKATLYEWGEKQEKTGERKGGHVMEKEKKKNKGKENKWAYLSAPPPPLAIGSVVTDWKCG